MLSIPITIMLARTLQCLTHSAMLEDAIDRGACYESVAMHETTCHDDEPTLDDSWAACLASIPRDWDLPMYPTAWSEANRNPCNDSVTLKALAETDADLLDVCDPMNVNPK